MTPKEIGNTLKQARSAAELTFGATAAQAGISTGDLIRIENGDWLSISEASILAVNQLFKSPVKVEAVLGVYNALINDLGEFDVLPADTLPGEVAVSVISGQLLAKQAPGRPVGLHELLAIVPAGWQRREDEKGFEIDEVLLSWMSAEDIELQVFTTIHKEHQRSMLKQSFLRIVVMDRRARKYNKVLAWSTRVDRREKRWKETLGQILGLLIVRTALRPKCLSCRAGMVLVSSAPASVPDSKNSALTSAAKKAVPGEQFWGCTNYPACARRFVIEPLPDYLQYTEPPAKEIVK